MHQFFTELRKRPGMYFGDPEYPFTRLVAFLDGYLVGYHMSHKADVTWPEDLIPRDFASFVCHQLGQQLDTDTKGWVIRVREHTSSEQEAFELFFRLMEDYEKNTNKSA